MNFFSEINVEKHHAEAIARGLFAIAHSDGLHEREAALVGSFWADTGGSMHALASLERGASITGDELATALTTPALRRLFLRGRPCRRRAAAPRTSRYQLRGGGACAAGGYRSL